MTSRSCWPGISPRCCIPEDTVIRNLADAVKAYHKHNRPKADNEHQYYAGKNSLPEAIRTAARCEIHGKRHSHQYRIPKAVLEEAERRLLKLRRWDSIKDFGELHKLINDTIRPIHGIGELAVYDIATRIGAYLNINAKKVYLHAGTREGARALGFDTSRGWLAVEELPREFRKLTAGQIEDCLCIYKADLEKLRERITNKSRLGPNNHHIE